MSHGRHPRGEKSPLTFLQEVRESAPPCRRARCSCGGSELPPPYAAARPTAVSWPPSGSSSPNSFFTFPRSPLPSPPFHCQDAPDFITVSDAPFAQDLLMRRRTHSEEVLVSALLAPLVFEYQEPLPRDLLMKVFVSKPGATPVLHFDCRGLWPCHAVAHLAINAVRYHSSPGDAREEKYEGPEFRDLDPQLKAALKEYLVARGVNYKLANSILVHLQLKEEAQNLKWLKAMEETFSKDH